MNDWWKILLIVVDRSSGALFNCWRRSAESVPPLFKPIDRISSRQPCNNPPFAFITFSSFSVIFPLCVTVVLIQISKSLRLWLSNVWHFEKWQNIGLISAAWLGNDYDPARSIWRDSKLVASMLIIPYWYIKQPSHHQNLILV